MRNPMCGASRHYYGKEKEEGKESREEAPLTRASCGALAKQDDFPPFFCGESSRRKSRPDSTRSGFSYPDMLLCGLTHGIS
jgi:hypothetical protein